MITVNSAPEVAAYEGLAAHYDELFGAQSALDRQAIFEWIVDAYDVRFTSAADVGCGTGTFVRYLLRSGVRPVWGVDLSPAMLAEAVAKNSQNGAGFLHQDLRELLLPEPVELLTCQFETLNYLLSDADLRTAFARFAAALTPGGYAVFDVATRRPDQPDSTSGVEDTEFASHAVTIRARYDAGTLLQVASVHVGATAGATETTGASETHIQRVHPIEAVIAALSGSGLVLKAMHDSTDVERHVRQAENVIFLAQRTH
jgi:SAM-dependent methyltransferase